MNDHPYLGSSEKTEHERSWTDHRMAGNVNWNACRSTHKMYLNKQRTLVRWTFVDGAPRVEGVYGLSQVTLDFHAGLDLILSSMTGHHLHVTSDPVEFFPGVFLWTPAFCDIRFAPALFSDPASPRRLSVPLMAKTRSRSDQPQEGHSYILPMREFVKAWPNISV